jgi:hypothetical protein
MYRPTQLSKSRYVLKKKQSGIITWKGTICSRRMSRCLISKSWPSARLFLGLLLMAGSGRRSYHNPQGSRKEKLSQPGLIYCLSPPLSLCFIPYEVKKPNLVLTCLCYPLTLILLFPMFPGGGGLKPSLPWAADWTDSRQAERTSCDRPWNIGLSRHLQ